MPNIPLIYFSFYHPEVYGELINPRHFRYSFYKFSIYYKRKEVIINKTILEIINYIDENKNIFSDSILIKLINEIKKNKKIYNIKIITKEQVELLEKLLIDYDYKLVYKTNFLEKEYKNLRNKFDDTIKFSIDENIQLKRKRIFLAKFKLNDNKLDEIYIKYMPNNLLEILKYII